MSDDWIIVLAVVCAAIGFISGILVATPNGRRIRHPRYEPTWKYERTVTRPITKESQTKRGKR